MIFKRLFSKTAPDPVLPPPPIPAPDPAQLVKTAIHHAEIVARHEACRQIDDLALLRQVAEHSDDPGTRDIATARYRKRICALETATPAQAENALQTLTTLADAALLEYLVLEARSPEVRRAALNKFPHHSPIWARSAVEDPLAANRSYAIEQISTRRELETVIRTIGKRDTKVYRMAREKLRTLAQQEAYPLKCRARAAELQAHLERLLRQRNLAANRAHFSQIEQEWETLKDYLEPLQQARFEQLRGQFLHDDVEQQPAPAVKPQQIAPAKVQPEPPPPPTPQQQQDERRRARHRRQVERKLQLAPEQLKRLDAHFSAGALRKAEPLYQKILATVAQARDAGLYDAQVADIERQLKTLALPIRELQRWRRWSADQHREALCAEAETLNSSDDLARLAAQLREIQRAWRALDQTGASASEALWQRFKTATDALHQRCQPYFAHRAQQQQANSAAAAALCEQLEHFLATVNWEQIDWKQMHRAEREMRAAWEALGALNAKDRHPLQRRFHRGIAIIDQALDAQRLRIRDDKRTLIERMEALQAMPDLQQAITEAKQLQQQWRTMLMLRRRDEAKLWKAFRAASDAVFARRDAQRQAAAEARRAQRAKAEELAKTEQSRQAATWQLLEQLAAQSDWLDQTATALTSGIQLNAATLRTEWLALPPPEEPTLAADMHKRCERLLVAADDRQARANLHLWLDNNCQHRESLCLRLEILAQLDSPTELNAQRMQMQVERLRERMRERETDTATAAEPLLMAWYQCAPAPNAKLHARLRRVLEQLRPEVVL